MSSKYDKSIQISREEEGSYHRREIENSPTKPSYTQSYQVVKAAKSPDTTDDDDNFEEWTTSKRKVNHKTRQVETRVSRQLLVEDGKVIADSGPQVTTRIKEDNKVEECEKEKTPKNKSKFDAIENAPEGESKGRVLGEKKEIQRVSREVREENMQYHDERFKELTGHDVHRRAIQAPHELITITDKDSHAPPRGKMVHYSNKGKKYKDTDEILEVAKLAIDGSITKEVKRTKHHEEFSDDEKPGEKSEVEALRHAPTVTRSSRRHADYVNDFDDTSTPSSSDDEGDSKAVRKYHDQADRQQHHHRHHSTGSSAKHHLGRSRETKHKIKEDEAFPRYEIDPLLNSLKDEDFKPVKKEHHPHGGRYKEHTLERKDRQDLSDDEGQRYHHRQRSPSLDSARGAPVEIPEEYRVNKQRLLSGKNKSTSSHQRERSFSPTNKSHLSHMSSKSHRSHKEDASVQAHLTDEEEEKKSMRSGLSEIDSHEKTTKHLQRQSTANSSRNYYFGEPRHRRRSPSIHSSSSSSLSDPKDRMRKNGARSKDSGFKSPHSMRTASPISTGDSQHQIYSVSSKAKKNHRENIDRGAVSPTPTNGSMGQRSTKTTTTTMSAGLADRPISRNERSIPQKSTIKNTSTRKDKRVVESGNGAKIDLSFKNTTIDINQESLPRCSHQRSKDKYQADDETKRSLDSVSLSSLGPKATTIKVPYKRVIEYDNVPQQHEHLVDKDLEEKGSEVGLKENIENLRKRLANIKKQTVSTTPDNSMKDAEKPEYFDYKTIVQSASLVPRQHIVDAYHVRVIEHNSPFHNEQPIKSVDDLSNSIVRLELLSSERATRNTNDVSSHNINVNCMDNNNEASFKLADYAKHKAVPVIIDSNVDDSPNVENDRISLVSSCSLRSSRTYDIRAAGTQDNQFDVEDLNEEKHFPVEVLNVSELDADEKKPSAWIFDLRDGSSTAIATPPRPKTSESPKVDSKTEELTEARGGRSYYLELIEPRKKEVNRQRHSSTDSLYSRWNSHSTLSSGNKYNQQPQRQTTPTKSPMLLTSVDTRRSRQMVSASHLDSNYRPIVSSSDNNNRERNNKEHCCQLPFSGLPLGNRSKSSSCLIGSTRPTKYSIYGGLKQSNGDNKPVPRLSYSRAIGPKSQRQIDAQSKTPSRYLKMK